MMDGKMNEMVQETIRDEFMRIVFRWFDGWLIGIVLR